MWVWSILSCSRWLRKPLFRQRTGSGTAPAPAPIPSDLLLLCWFGPFSPRTVGCGNLYFGNALATARHWHQHQFLAIFCSCVRLWPFSASVRQVPVLGSQTPDLLHVIGRQNTSIYTYYDIIVVNQLHTDTTGHQQQQYIHIYIYIYIYVCISVYHVTPLAWVEIQDLRRLTVDC